MRIRNRVGANLWLMLLITVAFVAIVALAFLPRFPVPATSTITPTPTPEPVSSNPQSKIGLHTRLTDEPDPAKIRKEFEMLREMGGSWATEFFPWIYIQPSDRERFDWTHADLVVNAANAEGITLLARVDGVPDWARPANTTWRYLDEAHYNDYGDFIYAFVSHFKGRLKYYIIWNEPNTSSEWGQRPPDPKAYADLLKVAYRRAKEADPNCVVLVAGLAPNLEHEGSPNAMNDLTYLARVYDAGGGPFFDGVAVHSYGLKSPANEPSDPSRLNFRRTEQTYKVMQSHGDGAKPVFVTEGGWNDSPRWSFAVTPPERVEYTVDAYRIATEDWPWCKAVTMWASRFPKPQYTYFDNYSFLTPDFIPKAVYLEVQSYARSQGAGISRQSSVVSRQLLKGIVPRVLFSVP